MWYMPSFQSAFEAHQAGRLQDAEQIYSAILQITPRHADALHLLGLIHSERDDLHQAEVLVRQALDIDENPVFLSNLASVLIAQGRSRDAEAVLLRAIEILPSYAIAHHKLAAIFTDTHRFDEAEAAYECAISHDATLVDASINLGELQMTRGKLVEAETSFRHACAVDPGRSRAHRDLGLLLTRTDRFSEAEIALRHSLSIAPGDSDARLYLGTLLLMTGRGNEGEAELHYVLASAPDHVQAHFNLGTHYMETHRGLQAETAFRRAIDLAPDHRDARFNLGILLAGSHRCAEAEAVYRQALELHPDFADVQWGLSHLLLKQGRYAEGWRLFESRFVANSQIAAPALPFPRWQGEPLDGKSLLVWSEQGFGDTLQFCRYLPALKHLGLAKLIVACQASLVPLIGTIEAVDHCIPLDDLQTFPRCDWWCATMSLPFHFGTVVETIPAPPHYLRVPSGRRIRWKDKLPATGIKVGLVWAGDARPHQPSANATDKLRSLACRAYMPLLELPGITFVSLQKGGTTHAQLNDIPEALRPLDLMHDVRDFADTAAIIEHLDLVISVDTSTAHLAGALGKPVWILSRFDGCWRWLEERDDSPWYPTARLFRQAQPGDWDDVIRRVKHALLDYTHLEHRGVAASQFRSSRLVDTESSMRRTLTLDPDKASAHFNPGELRTHHGRHDEADLAFRRSLKADPDDIDAHNRLGVRLMTTGRLSEAEAAFRRAISLDPDNSDSHNGLGALLLQSGRSEEGEAELRHALRLKPDSAQAHYNLGTRMMHTRRLAEAEIELRRTLELAPADHGAWTNLGNTLKLADRDSEAEVAYRKAIELSPRSPDARWSLALLLLSNGRYTEGWQYSESRFGPAGSSKITVLPDVCYAQWHGESLQGKSLVILHEQGLGDSIQFSRYAPMLKARGLRHLAVVCPTPLKPLLETVDGVDEVVVDVTLTGTHDFWVFTMSLPLHFNTTVETIPCRLPYLRALPERTSYWSRHLPVHGRKVGLVWKGNAEHGRDATRSLPGLETLAPLWSVAGVSFISLQKGQGEIEAEHASASSRLVHLGGAVADFADSAAIVAQLDLVISVDTSMAHLAGALGKACWVMLPMFSTDWRWLKEGTNSPWYLGVMRLFRQSRLDDWEEVVARMVVALREWAEMPRSRPGRGIQDEL